MRCPGCQGENLAGSLFCIECGAKIEVTCAVCGRTNPTGAKFCRQCGASLGAPASPRAPGLVPRAEPTLASMGAVSRSPAARSVRLTRLALVDWLLLGTLLPLAVFGFVMTVVHGVRGDFLLAPFLVSSAADQQSYPAIAQLWSSPSAEADRLAVGDRLLRLEDIDLRGVSNAGFVLHWSRVAQGHARALALTVDRGGVRFDVRVPRVPGYLMPSLPWWATLPFIVVSVGTAVLLLVRGAHWHLARRYFVTSLLVVFCSTPYFSVATAPRLDHDPSHSDSTARAGTLTLGPQRNLPGPPAMGARPASGRGWTRAPAIGVVRGRLLVARCGDGDGDRRDRIDRVRGRGPRGAHTRVPARGCSRAAADQVGGVRVLRGPVGARSRHRRPLSGCRSRVGRRAVRRWDDCLGGDTRSVFWSR